MSARADTEQVMKRQRHSCIVCIDSLALNFKSPCGCVVCSSCVRRHHEGRATGANPPLYLECFVCNAAYDADAVNKFVHEPAWYERCVAPAWMHAALREDEPHVAAASALLPHVRAELAWLSAEYAPAIRCQLERLKAVLQAHTAAALDAFPSRPAAGPDAVALADIIAKIAGLVARADAIHSYSFGPPPPPQGFTHAPFRCKRCPCTVVANATCAGCLTVTCLQCEAEAAEGHSCRTEDVESVRLIRASTKPCPECAAPISRIEGCAQMVCMSCKRCAFDFTTGQRCEPGLPVHNPHLDELSTEERASLLDAVNSGAPFDPATEPFGPRWVRALSAAGPPPGMPYMGAGFPRERADRYFTRVVIHDWYQKAVKCHRFASAQRRSGYSPDFDWYDDPASRPESLRKARFMHLLPRWVERTEPNDAYARGRHPELQPEQSLAVSSPLLDMVRGASDADRHLLLLRHIPSFEVGFLKGDDTMWVNSKLISDPPPDTSYWSAADAYRLRALECFVSTRAKVEMRAYYSREAERWRGVLCRVLAGEWPGDLPAGFGRDFRHPC